MIKMMQNFQKKVRKSNTNIHSNNEIVVEKIEDPIDLLFY